MGISIAAGPPASWRNAVAALAVATAGFAFAGWASAANVLIDLSGINTSSGSATGAAINTYLTPYGVSTPNAATVLDTTFYAPFILSPTKNVISSGDGRNPTTLTFNFSSPVSNVSFVRAGTVGALSPSGSIAGDPWRPSPSTPRTSRGSRSRGSITGTRASTCHS